MKLIIPKLTSFSGKLSVGFLIFVLISSAFAFMPGPARKISMQMETKTLSNGKQVIVNADLYYNHTEGKMVVHFTKPIDYVLITNNKGEAKIYNSSKNEVSFKQGMEFDTKNTLMYYFFANKQYDLGLKDLGFSMLNTKFEDGMMISRWKPPFSMNNVVGSVELVHENYLPIYIAYFAANGKMSKKIYYYDYAQVSTLKIPRKVVEFMYLSEKDSIVSKTTYSNFKLDDPAGEKYFNFQIPKNAKLVD